MRHPRRITGIALILTAAGCTLLATSNAAVSDTNNAGRAASQQSGPTISGTYSVNLTEQGDVPDAYPGTGSTLSTESLGYKVTVKNLPQDASAPYVGDGDFFEGSAADHVSLDDVSFSYQDPQHQDDCPIVYGVEKSAAPLGFGPADSQQIGVSPASSPDGPFVDLPVIDFDLPVDTTSWVWSLQGQAAACQSGTDVESFNTIGEGDYVELGHQPGDKPYFGGSIGEWENGQDAGSDIDQQFASAPTMTCPDSLPHGWSEVSGSCSFTDTTPSADATLSGTISWSFTVTGIPVFTVHAHTGNHERASTGEIFTSPFPKAQVLEPDGKPVPTGVWVSFKLAKGSDGKFLDKVHGSETEKHGLAFVPAIRAGRHPGKITVIAHAWGAKNAAEFHLTVTE